MNRIISPSLKSSAVLVMLSVLFPTSPLAAEPFSKEELIDDVNEHWIYDDWKEAQRIATIKKKPIFAVFRCVP